MVSQLRNIYILALLPPLFWAGNFIFSKSIIDSSPPFQLSFLRWVVASVFLFIIGYKEIVSSLGEAKKEAFRLIAFAFLGVVAFNSLVYIGLVSTSSVNAALINMTMPIFTVFMASLFFKERIGFRFFLGFLFSFFGVFVLIVKGDFSLLSYIKYNSGDFFILSAVFCWSLYTVLFKYWGSNLSSVSFLFYISIIGFFIHLPFVFLESFYYGFVDFSMDLFFVLVYLGIFPSVLAYVIWGKVIVKIGPSKASFFMYLMPVFSFILAFLFLGEEVRFYHFIGLVFVGFGVFLVNRKQNRQGGTNG